MLTAVLVKGFMNPEDSINYQTIVKLLLSVKLLLTIFVTFKRKIHVLPGVFHVA